VIGVTETTLRQNDTLEMRQLSGRTTNNQRSGKSQRVASLRVAQRSSQGIATFDILVNLAAFQHTSERLC